MSFSIQKYNFTKIFAKIPQVKMNKRIGRVRCPRIVPPITLSTLLEIFRKLTVRITVK